MKANGAWPGEGRRERAEKFNSLGWTDEGLGLIREARAKGVCVSCGRKSKSKLPLGDARRHIACKPACADAFYEQHYRSWATTKRAVTKRVRARFGGAIRCERCGGPPLPIERREKVVYGDKSEWSYFHTYSHPGYEFDHIVEVAAGGAVQDPDNVQLLCLRCHHRKTAAFARIRRKPSRYVVSSIPLESFSPVGTDK